MRRSVGDRWIGKPGFERGPREVLAVAIAIAFFAASFVPSLLPRPWMLQATVAGSWFALGYLTGWIVGRMLRLSSTSLVRSWRSGTAGIAVGAGGGLLAVLFVHYRWSLDVARLMGLNGRPLLNLVLAVLTGLAVGVILVLFGKGVHRAITSYRRFLTRWMPRSVSAAIVVVTLAIGGVYTLDVVILDGVFGRVEAAFRASDSRFEDDVAQPDSSLRAGGPESLVSWSDLGKQGRFFVSSGPSVDELETFGGIDAAVQPIRIYVGLQSGQTVQQRAALAIAEMERTGAFERRVIVLVLPTGTGWIDPYAIDPVEYMYAGDSASVALQYSYRPSWVVMLGNQDEAIDAAKALFTAVRQKITQRAGDARPALVIYGESLGSFGLEAVFDGIDDLRSQVDGALLVGPPNQNRIWSELTVDRDQGSPIWQPVYDGGASVRFGRDASSLDQPSSSWLEPRIAYLQHPSDPISWLSASTLWRRPEWLTSPLGADVSERMPFVPLVTFWQVAIDLVSATNAPTGHGHRFGIEQGGAWARIIPPDGWNGAQSARMLAATAEP